MKKWTVACSIVLMVVALISVFVDTAESATVYGNQYVTGSLYATNNVSAGSNIWINGMLLVGPDGKVVNARITNAWTAINASMSTNSTQDTSLTNAWIALLSAMSTNSTQDTKITGAMSTNSTQDTSLTNAWTALLSAMSTNSTQDTSLTNAWTALLSAMSTNSTQDTSLTNAWTALLSAMSTNSTQDTSLTNAWTALLNAITTNSTQDTSITNAWTALLSAMSTNSTQDTSISTLIGQTNSYAYLAKSNNFTAISNYFGGFVYGASNAVYGTQLVNYQSMTNYVVGSSASATVSLRTFADAEVYRSARNGIYTVWTDYQMMSGDGRLFWFDTTNSIVVASITNAVWTAPPKGYWGNAASNWTVRSVYSPMNVSGFTNGVRVSFVSMQNTTNIVNKVTTDGGLTWSTVRQTMVYPFDGAWGVYSGSFQSAAAFMTPQMGFMSSGIAGDKLAAVSFYISTGSFSVMDAVLVFRVDFAQNDLTATNGYIDVATAGFDSRFGNDGVNFWNRRDTNWSPVMTNTITMTITNSHNNGTALLNLPSRLVIGDNQGGGDVIRAGLYATRPGRPLPDGPGDR